jgi:DNA invertase Pin-like site-specific DNA recombinase
LPPRKPSFCRGCEAHSCTTNQGSDRARSKNARDGVLARRASLKATGQSIGTSTAAGKCFLDMLGVFAEFETNLRRERQLEGIAQAKAAGV